jgi:hypothetical protein
MFHIPWLMTQLRGGRMVEKFQRRYRVPGLPLIVMPIGV